MSVLAVFSAHVRTTRDKTTRVRRVLEQLLMNRMPRRKQANPTQIFFDGLKTSLRVTGESFQEEIKRLVSGFYSLDYLDLSLDFAYLCGFGF